MGKLIKTLRSEPVVTTAYQPPARQGFAIAIRFPDGRSLTSLMGGLTLLLASIAVILVLLDMATGSSDALVNAMQATIDAKDETIAALSHSNAQLAAANDNLAKVATTTMVGLDPSEFITFGAVCLMAIGMCLMVGCPKVPGAGYTGTFTSLVGIILLFSGA